MAEQDGSSRIWPGWLFFPRARLPRQGICGSRTASSMLMAPLWTGRVVFPRPSGVREVPRRPCGRMAWISCAGSGSPGRSRCRGRRPPGWKPAISVAGSRPPENEARRSCGRAAGFPGAPNPVTGKPSPGPTYAAATVAHSETVLRGFYELHRELGSGPMVNPFPLARRRGGRPHAHHNPMEPFRNERTGLYRPEVPSRVPRRHPGRPVQRTVRPPRQPPRPGTGRLLGIDGG